MKRQFSYQYKSYIENKHGFFTFLPNGKIFHPYFGLPTLGRWYRDAIGNPQEYDKFYKCFNHSYTFKHTVKMYFPEIKKGVVYVDKINYSVDSDPEDEISIDFKVNCNSDYEDYVEIKHHIAEFEIDITMNTIYKSPLHPVTINCDYIDVLLFDQKISITETTNSIKIVPYIYAHHTNEPLVDATRTNTSSTTMTNNSLTYTIGLKKESNDYVKKFKGTTSSVTFNDPVNYSEVGYEEMYEFVLEAFISNYSMDRDDKYNNKDIIPILNDNVFYDIMQTCQLGAKSDWYNQVYKRWDIKDTFLAKKCPDEIKYPYEETRSNVWTTIIMEFENSEYELLKKAEGLQMSSEGIQSLYSLVTNYKVGYKSDKIEKKINTTSIFNNV